jgi:CheY-like chemotaxis protein
MQNISTLETPSGMAPASSDALLSSAPQQFSAPRSDGMAPPIVSRQIDDGLPPILVADDDQDDVFFVQRFIKKTGVKNRVIAFDDGTEVVNYLSRARLSGTGLGKRTPLLLFLDLKMRGLGGFGFLEWARQHKELAPLTIVVLSNSSEPADVDRALELGAHRYLVKYPSVHTFDTIIRGVYPQVVY